MGFTSTFERLIKESYSQSRISNIGGVKVVVKNYGSPYSIKWYFITAAFFNYPYVADPRKRLSREMDFMLGDWKDFLTPRIIDFDLEEPSLTREFLEGDEPDSDQMKLVGKGLREVHDKGIVMGDTKVSNFLVSEGKLYVIDAEQSTSSDSEELKAWDLLVLFVFLAYKYLNDLDQFEKGLEAFLDSYDPDQRISRSVFNAKNGFLVALMPILHARVAQRLLNS
jgi:tRNA A-37 threonylcarbamoyl transferase component Bud32